MNFSIMINNIQHIANLNFNLDLSKNKLTCIIGKNGTGKTTLVKAIRNLTNSDTFASTSSKIIFSPTSAIHYKFGNQSFSYTYDPKTEIIDCNTPIPTELRQSINAELPIPHGERFNFFQILSRVDDDIRKAITLEDYEEPLELRDFLGKIYCTNKFDSLVEIKINNNFYYCIPLENFKYIREDYLSSGEYFLVNLYRKIRSRSKLIVIDEIDISLDAAAQSRLVGALRQFTVQYGVNIVFTTHSLPLMYKLNDDELCYIEEAEGSTTIEQRNYNYIASLLFGFTGRDKYIITEDEMLHNFLKYFIHTHCDEIECIYKIIFLNGAHQVIKLLKRNQTEGFLSTQENVAAVLDKDQEGQRYLQGVDNVYFLPFQSVEKKLLELFESKDAGFPKISDPRFVTTDDKVLYSRLRKDNYSDRQLFDYICSKEQISEFKNSLNSFFSKTMQAVKK